MKKKIAVITLGCKLNFAESSSIAQIFVEAGYEEVASFDVADIYIINTCTVTEHSNKKCRNLIRKAHKVNPNAILIVTGCYAELKREEIAQIEGVSAVVGQSSKQEIFKIAQKIFQQNNQSENQVQLNISTPSNKLDVFPAASFGERTRSFLKIQDGCDYFCTYCAIPFARGRSRAVPSETVLQMAHNLADKGVLEIVLTGINLGDYSRVASEADMSLLELLKKLNDIEGIRRFRISSIEPNLLSDDILDWIASGTKFQPHFHIPLQSGSDSVLNKMKRKYDTKLFKDKIDSIRKKIGDVFLGIDVIVGFPGETEEKFDETYNFLKNDIAPAYIHIFPFSPREGTLAYKMDNQIPESVKNSRVKRLEQLCEQLHKDYVDRYRGKELEVLFESSVKSHKSIQLMEGYTSNYIRVTAKYDPSLIGKIVKFTI